MAIFHSYVNLPEGLRILFGTLAQRAKLWNHGTAESTLKQMTSGLGIHSQMSPDEISCEYTNDSPPTDQWFPLRNPKVKAHTDVWVAYECIWYMIYVFNIIYFLITCLNCRIPFLLGLQLPASHQVRRQRQQGRKVGVYFGTFDPIHENHVGLAKFAPGCLEVSVEVDLTWTWRASCVV